MRIGGSEGRGKATGQGVAFCIEDYYADRGETLKGKTFILQGFGNVGSHAALILGNMGARLLAVNDADGTIYNGDGIDVNALAAYVPTPRISSAACSASPAPRRSRRRTSGRSRRTSASPPRWVAKSPPTSPSASR